MSGLSFHIFDPAGCGFPPPRLPILPTLRSSAADDGDGQFQALDRDRHVAWYARGRYALLDAYRLSGVGPGKALLAPAYHCRTMLDPAMRLNAAVSLYPLTATLTPDIDALQRILDSEGPRIGALLLAHYFGFPQALEPIRTLCDRHAIKLIEDCSHAFFNLEGRPYLGSQGDFTVASPYKFLPCPDGGILFSRQPASLPARARAPLSNELRAGKHLLQQALSRPPALPGSPLAIPPAGDKGSDSLVACSSVSPMYLPQEEGRAGLYASQAVAAVCDKQSIALRRRAHYALLAKRLAGVPHCRPLFPALPDNCAPYMFPLYIEQPETHFYALKRMGVPIWRWDEMAASECPVSGDYRLHLLHLPCHQSLNAADLDWMIDAIATTMKHATS